ncbi:disease resistance protein [Spatholobus suberectus]|nr:disease resistance protein [Spatholobus suberectus]
MIGLLGIGGSGKTTLAKEVGKKVEELKLFEKVVMVTVSETPNIRSIQEQIADQLDCKLGQESDNGKARRLSERLRNGTNLLILDDVWEWLNFEDIGIPFSENKKGCGVLLTTRDRVVCTSMQCQSIIELNLIAREEAWTLFKLHAKLTDDSPYALKGVAKKIVDECKGLPIAIVTVGSTLRGKTLEDWKSALSRLQYSKPLVNIPKGLRSPHACLQLSYDILTDELAKSLFLLCSIFPEDHEIHLEDLFRFGRDLGLTRTFETIEKAREEMHVAVNILMDSCLLLHAKNGRVKMHDMVRDVALLIASERGPAILASTAMDPRTIKDKRAIISLWDLQNDISFLESLQALEILDLRGSSFEELPNGIAALRKLKLLDLYQCMIKKNNAYEVIGRCLQLEELLRRYVIIHDRSDKISYLLPSILEGRRPSRALCVDGFNAPVQSFISLPIKDLFLRAEYLHFKDLQGGYKNVIPFMDQEAMNQLIILFLEHCPEIECLFDSTIISNTNVDLLQTEAAFSNLATLILLCMDSLQKVFHDPSLRCSLNNLQQLLLRDCKELYSVSFPRNSKLCSLKVLAVSGCPKLTSLFTPSVVQTLELLEYVETSDCSELKHIIEEVEEGHVDYVSSRSNTSSMLPKLKNLVIDRCESCGFVEIPNIAENCEKMRLMRLQLRSRCGCGESKNLYVAVAIAVADRNLEPWLEYILPVCFARGLVSLENLTIGDCWKLKYVFGTEKEHHLSAYLHQTHHETNIEINLVNFGELRLSSLPEHIDIWPQYCRPRSPNLKELALSVQDCLTLLCVRC